MPVNSSSCLLSCDLYSIYDGHYSRYTSLNQEESQVLAIKPIASLAFPGERIPCFIKRIANTYSKCKHERSQQQQLILWAGCYQSINLF